MQIEKIAFMGWDNCYKLSDDGHEMIVTADVGPRILHLSLPGGENILHIFEADTGQTAGDQFRFYGGHRLWRAPEDEKLTYIPDNDPLTIKETKTGLVFRAPVEAETQLQKELLIRMDNQRIVLTHRIYNIADIPSPGIAVWAITQMRTDGLALMPLAPTGSHLENLLPTQGFVLWAYTDLSDPRYVIAPDFLAIWQRRDIRSPQKIGLMRSNQPLIYMHPTAGTFIKSFPAYRDEATYPDLGSGAEIFTDEEILELETLGPLSEIQPGQFSEHVEYWTMRAPQPLPESKDDMRKIIVELVD